MDEPIADPSAIAIYRLSQVAREHITVALSGEGADELFEDIVFIESLHLSHYRGFQRT